MINSLYIYSVKAH